MCSVPLPGRLPPRSVSRSATDRSTRDLTFEYHLPSSGQASILRSRPRSDRSGVVLSAASFEPAKQAKNFHGSLSCPLAYVVRLPVVTGGSVSPVTSKSKPLGTITRTDPPSTPTPSAQNEAYAAPARIGLVERGLPPARTYVRCSLRTWLRKTDRKVKRMSL